MSTTASPAHPDIALRLGAEAILSRQAARESAARTYARSLPIVPVRARGMTVEGADGRRYLDCLAGAGTLALGHNHPVVLEAIRAVLDAEAPLHVLDLATPVKDAFTTALFETLPPSMARDARIQFCGPAGTDAVEAALKLVRLATGRDGLLAFTGGYHGQTAGALAATGDTAVRAGLGLGGAGGVGGQVTRLPYPYAYRCPFGVGGVAGAQLGTRWTRSLLEDPKGGVDRPAGMLVEVVQGEGGVVPAPDAWLREQRELTARHGIPLIVDEVQTGVGRTGAFWAVQHSGVEPDVMVVSKAVGGSLPLAAIVYRAELDVWAPGAHAGTFRGNQLAMAAGAATLRFVREQGLDARAAELGTRMLARLRGLQRELPVIGDVRGRGLMLGVELVDREAAPDELGAFPAAPELAQAVRGEALRRGLIVELGGRYGSVVRLLPPLTMTDEQAEAVLERLAESIAAAARALGFASSQAGSAHNPRSQAPSRQGPLSQAPLSQPALAQAPPPEAGFAHAPLAQASSSHAPSSHATAPATASARASAPARATTPAVAAAARATWVPAARAGGAA
ncbi:diaminobutyrate--2-oxoglutarate transaminase family protein [Streptacidiphilus rugosus]|uniref:diaminobutyrate--2-oxoglutarate transaminase family protein n=1 Tax=Streptacidiphilus rugosus TaxID=405783 RepID=UPI0009FBD11C|nr:diaminobutyrate--2-oxoglutarate transaminase family protein [Streptacidiphilus rugosus]